ncbi:cysteine/glutathione ABC transporter ATP-binding protein/permease CydC [[Haemophilus] felis]|uniref:Glutathione/L-cysteine transport system ATP-binding/permease protein CydC n=1 Tax=[Haemophilus] felis TaxID=123822 RepID=A0A1T0AVP5_9PAST|nr:cysteine/glutathione ABC transporter ATP-binding protein/permease CydC [[Haemophilus] felis]NBI41427.1 cysteine/glutathione ABC transporter ATP-binding protein/permease CydC [[Haemophilus] felis]OOS01029.1 cysteine/glutathione ABC transporter ATP-binding protein/permease CydC [[Haemophilus] felis]
MRSLLPFLRLFKHAKLPLFLGLILMITGLAASVGLLTLSGWFLAATAIAGVGALFNFFYPSAGVRGLAIGRTVARYFEKVVTHDATFRVLAKLRVEVFRRIIPLSPSTLNRYRNSDLLNRLVADVDTLDSLYLRLTAPFVSAIVVIGFITLGLSFIDTWLAYFIGFCLLSLLLVIPTLFYNLGKAFGEKLTLSRSQYRTQFVEFIQSQAELLLFNGEQQVKERMNKTEQEWQRYQQREANLSGLSGAILLLCSGLLISFTLWFSTQADLGTGVYKAAYIALFTFSALSSFEILMPIGAAFLHIGQIVASAQRINEITQQAPLVAFNGELDFSNMDKTKALIEAKNLCFSYPEQEYIALNKLSLNINAMQKVAILGKTGSGKSTLLQLLVRNYDAQQGELHLAGLPINAYSESALRQQICFLTQRVHIFSDTLRNNLQLASEKLISDATMLDILEKVGLNQLIEQPEKLDLWLGAGGRPLSGGEQRRLGLARVLLNQAPIILLDEPTEGLDRETERQILQLILRHCENKTLIMVTHRLTFIEKFDQLFIIDEGKLIEQGSYNELISKPNGYFYRLNERF